MADTVSQAEPLVRDGLKSRILFPSQPAYAARIESYWCNNAKLRPSCIFQPQSADEVSRAVTALAKANQPFAVRSGGHTNWAGSNNIDDGVTIDLGLLNSTVYDSTCQTAHIGPGGKWKDVYAELEKHGRTVAGGREAEVGVAGFLLGGGNNYKTVTLQEVLTYSSLPPNYYNIWFTLTVKNDPSIVLKAAELHNALARELQTGIPDQDFTSHVAFQPVPRLYVQQSHATNRSGNVLGLEQNTSDAILIQASASVRTAELEAWARPKIRTLIDEVRTFANTVNGGVLPWVYLNYAHSSQEVLRSYGPENTRRIREEAQKYDPEGVFQRLCPGGFKISTIED